MALPRRALVFLMLAWAFVTLYPDPGVLVSSVRNLLAPRADARAAQALAATLPDDPREVERRVLADVVPYASDWEAAGVPWSFPSAAQALQARRGDCESRALVLGSVLAAKGIPHQLRMSFDHIWVDYPGKVPTASENDARALTGTGDGGWSWLRWPDDLDLGREARAQAAIYWGPMPAVRKALLFAGMGWIVLWNAFVRTLSRPPVGRPRLSRTTALRRALKPLSAGGGPSWRWPPGARQRRRASRRAVPGTPRRQARSRLRGNPLPPLSWDCPVERVSPRS